MKISLSGTVIYSDILAALDIDEIKGVHREDDDAIFFDEISVDADVALEEFQERDLIPEPDEDRKYSLADLRDAFKYLRCGEAGLARIMFDRIFEGDEEAQRLIAESLREMA